MDKKLPSDSDNNNSSVPDFYRPTYDVQRIISPQQRPTLQRQKVVTGALLAELILWFLSQFFTSRGVPSVVLSRVFLVLIFLTGTALIHLIYKRERWISLSVVGRSIILAVLLILIDRFVPKPEAALRSAPILQPTPMQAPYLQATIPSPTPIPRARRSSTPTANLSPLPLVTEVARIGLTRTDISTNDLEHKIDIPILLTNFSNEATEGKLEPTVLMEYPKTGEKTERQPDGIEMVSFGPRQDMTYTFHIGGDEDLYKKIISGDVITTLTVMLVYKRNMSDNNTVTYKLIVKPDFKAHQVGIIYSGWGEK